MKEGRVYITILVLLALTAFSFIRGCVRTQELRAEVESWQLIAAERDTLHRDSEDRYHRAAVELENQRQIRRQLEAEIPEIAQELQRTRARISSYSSTIAHLEDILAQGAAAETLIVSNGDTVRQVSFSVSRPGIRIEGWTRTPPPLYSLQVEHEPIKIGMVISELRSGEWRKDIQVPEWVRVSSLDVKVVSQDPSWWDKNHKWLYLAGGIYIGRLLFKP